MKILALAAALAPLLLGGCATLFGASPFAFDKKGDLVEFNYAWSAEASRQPALVRQLRGDLERAFTAAAAAAEADRDDAKRTGRQFRGHRFTRRWTTAGQSARLVSLDGRLSASTGTGPSHRADALLWERSTRSEIRLVSLFVPGSAAIQLIRAPGCSLLARGLGTAGNALAPRSVTCPRAADLAVLPSDENKNRRFDHIRFVTPAAGAREPFAVAALPVTPALLALLKPEYRAGFEVAQPQ